MFDELAEVDILVAKEDVVTRQSETLNHILAGLFGICWMYEM
jgi:hypothetical protein